MKNNEGKGVDQGQDEHGVAGPVVEDLQLFMRDASQCRDEVGFGAEDSIQS